MVFHRDAPKNEKLVFKRSILGLGRVMNRDVARVLEQIKYGDTEEQDFCMF